MTTSTDNVILYNVKEFDAMNNTQLRQLAKIYGVSVSRQMDRDEVIVDLIDAQHDWCVQNGKDDPNQHLFQNMLVRFCTRLWCDKWFIPTLMGLAGLLIGVNVDVTGDTPNGVSDAVWIVWIAGLAFLGIGLGNIVNYYLGQMGEEETV